MTTRQKQQRYFSLLYALLATVGIFSLLLSTSAAAVVTGFASALQNLQEQLGDVWKMLTALMQLMSVALMFSAIYQLKVYGRMTAFMSQNASILKPMAYLLVSALFWYVPYLLDASIETIWGYDYSSVKSYELSTDATWNALIEPIVLLVRVIGLIAFIRGWILVLRSTKEGQQPGGLGKGIMHIIGGILGINLLGTIDVIRATFGY